MSSRMNRRKRLVGVLAILTLSLLFVGFALYLYGRPNPSLAENENYAVYSAYITQGLTGDSHDLGSRDGLVVIRERTTVSDLIVPKNKLSEWRFLAATLPHALRNLSPRSCWPIVNLVAANLGSEQLQPRFTIPAQYKLANDADMALHDEDDGRPLMQRFPKSYGYLTFTRIGFNRDLTEALFYTEHICGLCGGGQYMYMRKVNGKWIVQEKSGTWIS